MASHITNEGRIYCSDLAESLIHDQEYAVVKNSLSQLVKNELIIVREHKFIKSLLKRFSGFYSSQVNFENDMDKIFIDFMRDVLAETQYTAPYFIFREMLEYASQQSKNSVFEEAIFYYPEKNVYEIIEEFIPFLTDSFKDKIFSLCVHKLNDNRANIFIFTIQKILEYISRVEKPDIIYSSHQRAWT